MAPKKAANFGCGFFHSITVSVCFATESLERRTCGDQRIGNFVEGVPGYDDKVHAVVFCICRFFCFFDRVGRKRAFTRHEMKTFTDFFRNNFYLGF